MRAVRFDTIVRDPRAKTEAEQLEFFERCHERFRRATNAAGDVRRFFRIGEKTVCLTFAGENLVPYLTPALNHLRVSKVQEPVDLTLCIWDSNSTATEMIPLPCRQEDLTARGEIWGFDSDRIKTAFHWDEGSVNLLDHDTRTGIYWVPEAAAMPHWVRSAPLRTLFHWWMERNGHQLLHAAAVGADGRAVLLAGRGGAGKSTAALSCLRSGLQYLADDYLVVRLEPEPRAYSLYCTAKVNADHLANFPDLRALVRNAGRLDREKAVLYLHPKFRRQITKEMTLQALLTPRITGGDETTLRPTRSRDIERAIAFGTMSQLPHAGGHTHDTIRRLAATLPGYALEMGRHLHKIPTAIARFLAERPRWRAQSVAPAAARAAAKPLVSVIIPVLNGGPFVADVVHSVHAQDYAALELIVVERGPTDQTGQIVSQLPSDIRYFWHPNADPASALNRGIREAAGELIAFWDVDAPWPDHHLTSLIEELRRNPELDVAHRSSQLAPSAARPSKARGHGNLTDVLQFSVGAALCRTSVFSKIGLFDTTRSFGQAYEWFDRAAKSGVKMGMSESAAPPAGQRDLNTLRAFKAALDRRRAIEAQAVVSE